MQIGFSREKRRRLFIFSFPGLHMAILQKERKIRPFKCYTFVFKTALKMGVGIILLVFDAGKYLKYFPVLVIIFSIA